MGLGIFIQIKKTGLGIITIGYFKVAYDEFGPHLKKLYL